MLLIKVFVISLSIMESLSDDLNRLDPVMATFQVCDSNVDNGLNIEEITQVGCKEVLQTLFGLSTHMLQDTFLRLDENMDKVISIEEGLAASQSFDRLGQRVSTFGTKVLVTGGNSLATEIIDLTDSSFICNKVGKFPKPLHWANGGWVRNEPMVCGGTAKWTGHTFQKSCFTLQGNGAWKEDKKAELTRGKDNRISGSVVIKDGLLIPEYVGVGKQDMFGMYEKGYLNFEIAAPNVASYTPQSLNSLGFFDMMPKFFHNKLSCIVKWDADTIMLIGVNEGGKGTFFINFGNKTVTPGPKLMQGRSWHACHEMTVQGESFIVVTGGIFLSSTEILFKSSFGKGWQKGPNSPVPLMGHQMVATNYNAMLYTIGNLFPAHSKKIFQFSCEDKSMTKCKWTEMVTKLKEGRTGGHVAIPISDDLTEAICNDFVLVTTGGDLKGPSLTTEIINLENPSFVCTKVGKFPKALYGANGGWVGNKPMVCGGSGTDNYRQNIQKSCYTLQENGAWKEDENATLIRGKQNQITGSVVINDQLFIPEYVGAGKKSVFGYEKSYLNFEKAAPNTNITILQPLNSWGIFDGRDLFANKFSCIVKWDANTIMLIGANSGWKDTYFINMGNKTVTRGPQLMQGRIDHACQEITVNNLYTQKSESFIVVTGGHSQSGYPYYLNSTEILPKSPYNHFFGKGWLKGPDTPVELYGHQMVASSDKTKLYTIGNRISADNKRIFQLTCWPLCVWKEMKTKLKEGRYGHVAIPISNELTKKICN